MLKLTTFMMMVLFVGLVFTTWQISIDDYEQNYIVSGITNTSNVSEDFKSPILSNQTSSINSSFNSLLNELAPKNATSEQAESGGFRIIGTLFAVVTALLALPFVILDNVAIAMSQIVFIAGKIGIPEEVLAIGITALFIGIIIVLLNAKRKYEA